MEFNATFLVSAVSFIVFVFIMNAILYKPVLKIMEERKEYLNDNEAIIAEVNKDSDTMVNKKREVLAQAKLNAAKLVSEGSEKFKSENRVITEEFAKQQRNIVEEEKNKIREEAENSKQELESNSSDLSKVITDKILGVKNV